MSHVKVMICLVLALCVFLPSASNAYRLEETWERSFETEDEIELIVRNVNGSINVEGWDRDRVEIFAEIRIKAPSKSEARKLFKRIEFNVDAESDIVSIEADVPRKLGGGLFGWFRTGSSISITYTIRTPRKSEIDLQSVNGAVRAEDIEGRFHLKTTNGGIDLDSFGGEGDIKTVNGGVECRLRDFPDGGELSIKTVNGGVDLVLPDDTGAEVDIKTTNGRARMDFDLEDVKVLKKKRIRGEIGNGRGLLYIRTTNGGVSIDSR